MGTTPDFGIPELSSGQANPDITHNEALALVQALLGGVLDKDLTAPPGSPTEGDAYLINTAAPTGAWAGRGYCVAIYWGGSWRFIPGNNDAGTPITMGSRQEGMRVWVRDENKAYVWQNSAGSPLAWHWSTALGVAASDISNTPAGGIAATNVQTALNELDTEKYTPGANTLPLADLANASSQYDIVGRKTASGGAWEDCTRTQLLLAGTDLANTFIAAQSVDFGSGSLPSGPSAVSTGLLVNGADATQAAIGLQNFGARSLLYFRSSGGTRASQTALGNAAIVSQFLTQGYNGSAYVTAGDIVMRTTEAWGVGANGTQIELRAVQAGTASNITVAVIKGGGGLAMVGATGGDQGSGTVNATGVYDDGVLLCAPLHMDDADKNTQEFWDGLVPNRKIITLEETVTIPAVLSEPDVLTGEQVELSPAREVVVQEGKVETIKTVHRTARRHFDMIAEGFNPRDPQSWVDRLMSDRSVPGLPTLAEHEERYPVRDGERIADDKYSVHERTERMALAMDYMALTVSAMWEEIKTLRKG